MKLRIGLLIDYLLVNYQEEFYAGVVERAEELGIKVAAFQGGSLRKRELHWHSRNFVYNFLDKTQVQGIIAPFGSLGNYLSPWKLMDFCSLWAPLPMVSVGAKVDNIPSVIVNNKTGFRDLLNHIIDAHKARRIAFIKGPEGAFDAEERFEVYLEVLKSRGLPFDPSLVVKGDFTNAAGIQGARTLLEERKTPFDFLVGGNDIMAIFAMEELGLRGIQIPGDVGVAGFDNSIEACLCHPSLSTVEQPIHEMARLGVDLLLGRIEGKPVPSLSVVNSRMVIRESCGCSVAGEQDTSRVLNFSRNGKDYAFYRTQQILEELNSTTDIQRIKTILDEQLCRISIPFLYVALFQKDGRLAPFYYYHHDEVDYLTSHFLLEDPYPGDSILPGAYPDISFAVLPLFFESTPLGIIITSVDRKKIYLNELLIAQLSNAINAAEVSRELREYAHKLETQVNERTGELNEAWKALQKSANKSGLADVAAGILHNFGNILLTLKTSTSLVWDMTNDDIIRKLEKANALLEDFIDPENEQAMLLSKYYQMVTDQLQGRLNTVRDELSSIDHKVELLEETIETQRKYTSKIEFQEEDLLGLMHDSLSIARNNLFKQEVKIVKNFPPEKQLFIRCSKIQVFNILINLLKNSYESMVMYNSPVFEIVIDVERKDGFLMVRITDTGGGLSSEELKSVFKYGYSTKQGSRGLGLHITSLFIKEMGGSIVAESPGVGKGASFTISFPAINQSF